MYAQMNGRQSAAGKNNASYPTRGANVICYSQHQTRALQ